MVLYSVFVLTPDSDIVLLASKLSSDVASLSIAFFNCLFLLQPIIPSGLYNDTSLYAPIAFIVIIIYNLCITFAGCFRCFLN